MRRGLLLRDPDADGDAVAVVLDLAACSQVDANQDGVVSVVELSSGIRSSLDGCPLASSARSSAGSPGRPLGTSFVEVRLGTAALDQSGFGSFDALLRFRTAMAFQSSGGCWSRTRRSCTSAGTETL
jgi:hypothetical protein